MLPQTPDLLETAGSDSTVALPRTPAPADASKPLLSHPSHHSHCASTDMRNRSLARCFGCQHSLQRRLCTFAHARAALEWARRHQAFNPFRGFVLRARTRLQRVHLSSLPNKQRLRCLSCLRHLEVATHALTMVCPTRRLQSGLSPRRLSDTYRRSSIACPATLRTPSLPPSPLALVVSQASSRSTVTLRSRAILPQSKRSYPRQCIQSDVLSF